ncbi:hypothetical protein G4B88_015738 [Cannabis sativa]|uniref:Uncharacterized protein n=1 Tax=Cannabis sativa TaxID=3483 RepID=A0A7J6H8E3_CANSA|nr:hypothetical protein G4B88_015738 [Cannabis sativa]
MEEILKRFEYLANQIGNLNLGKNVVEVQPSGSSRVKTSLPDEPELYEHNEDIVKFEKKTRHLGCVMEHSTDHKSLRLAYCGSSFRSLHLDLFPNLKTLHIESSDYFEVISVSDGKSLEELTSLSIRNCGSFVSFPNDELIAPKLSSLRIANCRKLKWLLEKTTILSALNELEIIDCPLLEPFPEDARERSLPVTLSSLNH